MRRPIALDDHRQVQLSGRCLQGADQIEIVFQELLGRQEDVDFAVTRLGAERVRTTPEMLWPTAQWSRSSPASGSPPPAWCVGYGRDLLPPRRLGDTRGKRRPGSERIELDEGLEILLAGPGQRPEWQAKAHRRVARQEEGSPAQFPAVADPPAPACIRRRWAALLCLERQDVGYDLVQAAIEDLGQTVPFDGVVELALAGIEVHRQLLLAPR